MFLSFLDDSRIKPVNNILYIHNINYEDRKKYTCIGLIANDIANKPVTQVIILRVKGKVSFWKRIKKIWLSLQLAMKSSSNSCWHNNSFLTVVKYKQYLLYIKTGFS